MKKETPNVEDNAVDENTTAENNTTEETEVKRTASSSKADKKTKWPYIFIPKKNPKDLQRVFGLNGKNYIVQTGKQVQVPPAIEEIYRNSLTAEEEQYAYDEQVKN